MLEKKRADRVNTKVKSVPVYVQSSKFITAEKKANTELMKKMEASRETKGKGGR